MSELTPKQQGFVTGKLNGLPHREAAIHAGYAASSAEQTATKLMKHPAIKAALRKAKRQAERQREMDDDLDGIGESAQLEKGKMPREVYVDPKDFLLDTMNLQTLPHAVRMDAAKQLMPFMHAKVAEKGKKESKREAAERIANGEQQKATGTDGVVVRGRFQTKEPPGGRR